MYSKHGELYFMKEKRGAFRGMNLFIVYISAQKHRHVDTCENCPGEAVLRSTRNVCLEQRYYYHPISINQSIDTQIIKK